jgi:hypothetical protein
LLLPQLTVLYSFPPTDSKIRVLSGEGGLGMPSRGDANLTLRFYLGLWCPPGQRGWLQGQRVEVSPNTFTLHFQSFSGPGPLLAFVRVTPPVASAGWQHRSPWLWVTSSGHCAQAAPVRLLCGRTIDLVTVHGACRGQHCEPHLPAKSLGFENSGSYEPGRRAWVPVCSPCQFLWLVLQCRDLVSLPLC